MLPPEPSGLFNEWEYGEIIRRHVPALVQAAGEIALHVLCDHLGTALQISREEGDAHKPEDYSYIWRPAIEDSEQNLPAGIKTILVTAVRDAATAIVAGDLSRMPAIVETLEAREWFVFRRIALHLLAEFPDADPDLLAARLTDRSLFDEVSVRHEYARLLGRAFASLEPDQRATILDWIEQGPNLERIGRLATEAGGRPPSDEELAQRVRIWKRDRHSWIGDALPQGWAERYRELAEAFGTPDHADFVSWRSGLFTGPNSPKTEDELRALPAIDVVGYLSAWRPPEDEFKGPSPEGLGRALTAVVASNPRPYALVAPNFRGLDPTYVHALLTGFRDALKQGRNFDWEPVVALCRSVATEPWSIEPRDPHRIERDLDWSGCNQSIAQLLSTALEGDTLSLELQDRVWEVLRQLTEDPEPTLDYETRYGGSNMDPLTISINTARGEALHAVVRYALWVRRITHEQAASTIGAAPEASNFDSMPEVRDVLERHLDLELDPALAVRAVYGQWLPWLVLLDMEWTTRHLAVIFPGEAALRAYLDAAWETYLFYSRLFDNVFDLLQEEYARAVDRIGSATPGVRRRADPDERLGEHLMVMYWRGNLVLDEPNGLLGKFFDRAPDRVKGRALEFIGRNLDAADPPDPEIAERLRSLWESRLAAAREAGTPADHTHELSAFGWWFDRGKFGDDWTLAQLLAVLRLGVLPEPEHVVIERLPAMATTKPIEALEVLRRLAELDTRRGGNFTDHATTSAPSSRSASPRMMPLYGRLLLIWCIG